MIICVLLCYPVSIHMSQLLSTGHPISSYFICYSNCETFAIFMLQFMLLEHLI